MRAAERLFGQHDDLARFLRHAGVGGAASASGLSVRHRFGSPPAAAVAARDPRCQASAVNVAWPALPLRSLSAIRPPLPARVNSHFILCVSGCEVRKLWAEPACRRKIRRRAEFELYLRANTASNPSSTSWRLVRSTVAMLVSSAAAIQPSLQPSPASDTSAFKRMCAFASNWAERLPLRINSLSSIVFLRVEPDHVFLDGNLFPGHESPPSLPCRDRDFRISRHDQ